MSYKFKVYSFDIPSNILSSNILKQGLTTQIKENGAIKGFSFQEKQELNRLSEIENYSPKKVRIVN
jgi:hypothetical protein